MAVARGVSPEAVEAEYADRSGYARFKEDAGSAVAEYLAPIRERYEAIRPGRDAARIGPARGAEGPGDLIEDGRDRGRPHGPRAGLGGSVTPSAGSDDRPEERAAFAVELPVFSGPFTVLADLLLDQKIDVCDVRSRR